MKQTTKRRTSYRPWLVAIGCVLALALVVVMTSPGARQPSNGHAPVVVATGRSDASFVLYPARFADSRQREAYAAARQVPAILNQLYCWCGCKENPATHHRALLECYESEHASGCDICMGEATLARSLVEQGVTDVRRIQDQIDLTFAPKPTGS
jgi:hypothetical protein